MNLPNWFLVTKKAMRKNKNRKRLLLTENMFVSLSSATLSIWDFLCQRSLTPPSATAYNSLSNSTLTNFAWAWRGRKLDNAPHYPVQVLSMPFHSVALQQPASFTDDCTGWTWGTSVLLMMSALPHTMCHTLLVLSLSVFWNTQIEQSQLVGSASKSPSRKYTATFLMSNLPPKLEQQHHLKDSTEW